LNGIADEPGQAARLFAKLRPFTAKVPLNLRDNLTPCGDPVRQHLPR
jgi:hypothetical protein